MPVTNNEPSAIGSQPSFLCGEITYLTVMALKAILFDAAGTLIKTARPVGETYASLAKRHGLEVSPEQMGERFKLCFSAAPPLAFPEPQSGELLGLEQQWWKDLVRGIFEPYGRFAHFDDYFSELFGYFARAEAWTLYPETREVLSFLKNRGFTLMVVSNFDSRLLAILDGLDIASRFDSIVLSSRVGYAKPAPEIFQAALKRHQLKTEEALHIGDSREKDALGATRAGLKGVWLDRNGSGGLYSVPRIRNLKELLPLINHEGTNG